LDPNWEDLLCLDDVPISPFPSNRFVLVDHNRLLGQYTSIAGPEVVGILDHHEDEGFHLDANPRTIKVPTGSCASLVATHFRESKAWTPELATLLLCSIVVDTGGLKAGGKATPTDHEAAQLLLPLSSLHNTLQIENFEDTLNPLTEDLLLKKGTVSHLSNRDLLRRDYKQYQYIKGDSSSKSTITVGLSTIPIDLKEWVHKDPNALSLWMKERDIMIHGSLTTFRRVDGKGKSTHRRQQLWILREDVSKKLVKAFWNSLESSEELEVEKMKDFEEKLGLGTMEAANLRMRVYKQGNTQATRKVVAPLVKLTIENFLAGL